MLPTIRARLRAGAQAKEIGPATSSQLAGPPSVPPPGALLTPPEVAERLRVALKTPWVASAEVVEIPISIGV